METIEYRDVVDKSDWERGPWDDEPDKVQWQDESTGLPCLIVRGPVGALCGYVGVPKDHPWHGRDYDAVEPYPDVHGGLTFADRCGTGAEAQSVCHVPGAGEPDDVWWLGFDCAHINDKADMKYGSTLARDDVYRDLDYVKRETASLAKQARLATQ